MPVRRAPPDGGRSGAGPTAGRRARHSAPGAVDGVRRTGGEDGGAVVVRAAAVAEAVAEAVSEADTVGAAGARSD